MFLKKVLECNRPLVEFALHSHRSGTLLPDTYLLDLDAILENALLLLEAGRKNGVKLYFMTKQIGRTPSVSRALAAIGFEGAVCVDFREALSMAENGVPIGNVGHLVQVPKGAMNTILNARPNIVTVYSVEKAEEVSAAAEVQGYRQDVMLRVAEGGDVAYPGQAGGFRLDGLKAVARAAEKLPGVRIAGVTAFPCLLFDEKKGKILPSRNMNTVQKGAEKLRAMGFDDLQVNMPSANCVASIPLVAQAGGTHAEPGHSLTGTTPYHALSGCGPERPAIVYLSEVSHNRGGRSYCYAGGYYPRGNLRNALVGNFLDSARMISAVGPPAENIDYHIELGEPAAVSQAVVMSFRTQVFVTRSQVAVVEGLAGGNPRVEGIYSAQGHLLRLGT